MIDPYFQLLSECVASPCKRECVIDEINRTLRSQWRKMPSLYRLIRLKAKLEAIPYLFGNKGEQND